MPEYWELGYSRREAEQVVRIVERLWDRYTARGLTIDSPDSTPTALDPFEVLVQAMWHFGVHRLFRDGAPSGTDRHVRDAVAPRRRASGTHRSGC